MFRLFFLAFHGPARTKKKIHGEDPLMVLPVIFLAIPSVIAGYFSGSFFEYYVLPPVTGGVEHAVAHHLWLPVAAGLAGVAGIILAWLFYGRRQTDLAASCRNMWPAVHRLVDNKFYIDEMYLAVTHGIIFRCIAGPVKWFDRRIVDGTMNMVGRTLHFGSAGVRFIQNGRLTIYLGISILGIVFLSVCGF
jgi:NADH-quinone oxidoreductase subunit L